MQQQPSVDHGTLTQVLLSSIGQVRTTQTQAQPQAQMQQQGQDTDWSKLIQVLVPALSQGQNGSSEGMQNGVLQNGLAAAAAPVANAPSQNMASSAALSTAGGTDSLVTLVTLLLLQAQQQK